MTEAQRSALRLRMREVRRDANGDILTLDEYASRLRITEENEIVSLRELSAEPEFRYSIWATDKPGIHAISSNFGKPGPVVGTLANAGDGTWKIVGDVSGKRYASRHQALLATVGILN